MIGHVRRVRRSAELRRRWWASLSDDEREMVTFRERVHEPRAVFRFVAGFVCFGGFVALMIALGS
jgi:hypothetical protein